MDRSYTQITLIFFFFFKHTTEGSICTKSDLSGYRFLMVYHNQLEHSYENKWLTTLTSYKGYVHLFNCKKYVLEKGS